MEDAETVLNKFLKNEARPFAVHEAGHAVVALALDGDVPFVELDCYTLDGGKALCQQFADNIENLAVCVAGCCAEHLLGEFTRRKAKRGDFKLMREFLSRFPERERRTARARGYELAKEKLKTNANFVRRIADELMRRWNVTDRVVRIERDELIALLAY
jgi:hypothetical protein